MRLKNDEKNLLTYLTCEEIKSASGLLIKSNQKCLVNRKDYNEIKNNLNLFENERGIIWSHGRIMNADLPYETRKPIMLDRNNKLTELLVWECHENVKHNGIRETVAEFHSKFWVTRGRSCVKKILFTCVRCRYLNSRPYPYSPMPVLPKCRLRDDHAFSAVGIDHFDRWYVSHYT